MSGCLPAVVTALCCGGTPVAVLFPKSPIERWLNRPDYSQKQRLPVQVHCACLHACQWQPCTPLLQRPFTCSALM